MVENGYRSVTDGDALGVALGLRQPEEMAGVP